MINTPKLAIAIGYIDEDLIIEAIDYVPDNQLSHAWKRISTLAACVILVIGICLALSNSEILDKNTPPLVSSAPAHFYFEGSLYSFSGELVYSLPENFVLIGEVNNVGDSYTYNNFEGNVDGYIYMNQSNKAIAYFQWKEWDEAADGKEPYLALVKTE